MNKNNNRIFLGLLFILIGAVWLLDNFDLIPRSITVYLYQWENILIFIGLGLLISRENIRVGGILLALGVFFSLDHWFGIELSIWNLWPLALVFIGIYLIGRRSEADNRLSDQDQPDAIDDTAIFSGRDQLIKTQNFRGGRLTAIFGGSNIDLTVSDMQDSPVVIDVFYLFGGSKIRIPQDWQVDFHATNIFGGMSDKRTLISQTNANKKLIIKGLVVFGGSEITN